MNAEDFWGPQRGAVSLTFDDGHPTQLEKGLPLMDELGIRGTFCLNPRGEDWRARMAPWKQVAARGHELANHTLTHPGSVNLWGRREGGMYYEDLTLEEIEADILAAQERLVELDPSRGHWTFSYPCDGTFVGRGSERRSYVPVVAKHFLAARVSGEPGFGARPEVLDLAAVPGLRAERMTGFEMIGLVEGLAAAGQWVVLVFHEIDGPRLTVGACEFKMLLDHLKRRESEIWTAPFCEVAERIVERRAEA
jgi:peptidoglycan/xylan/chitin deacetylase (PgdA/CDA1 family)